MAKVIKFEGKKTPFNYEKLHSVEGERAFAESLEKDDNVLAWTKNHGIAIKYRNEKGGVSRYFPDFLVRRKNQKELELVEIKGSHLMNDPNIEAKRKKAEDWCHQRGMKYKFIKA